MISIEHKTFGQILIYGEDDFYRLNDEKNASIISFIIPNILNEGDVILLKNRYGGLIDPFIKEVVFNSFMDYITPFNKDSQINEDDFIISRFEILDI